MVQVARQLRAGTLWPALIERTEAALACGALHPIETVHEFVEDAGVRFLVRRVSSLARKDRDKAQRAGNPFLPCEEALFVADVSATHVALLNKFNVIERHLLIVTRAFEHQERLLTRADFAALQACMAEFEALGFYNGGEVAGASQSHKHLQMVPLPLAPEGPAVPMEPLLDTAPEPGIARVPGLPFAHAFCRLPPGSDTNPAAAETLDLLYRDMLDAVGIRPLDAQDGERQSAPYNLLVTRRWMLLVPRTREFFDGISVNALGYAGSIFVRDENQLQRVREAGPMAMLAAVGRPREAD